MAYLDAQSVADLGFAHVGKNVRLSTRAAFYDTNRISIDDNSRIDDFCLVSGSVEIGRNVHIAAFSNVAGGPAGVALGDFCTLAYGCQLIAQSDDYSGAAMTSSTVPRKYKNERAERISVGRHTILGTNTVVLPGVTIPEGVASGAGTLFIRSADPWTMYVGSPARPIKPRSQALLALEYQYLSEED